MEKVSTSRRGFLKVGSASLFGLGLADMLRAEAAARRASRESRQANSVIFIWLAGGPATIDMWDPKPDAPEEIRGEFQSMDTAAPGIQISEHLARTAKVMDQVALVRSLHHSIPAHGPGTQYMMTGNRPSPALEYPSVGSIVGNLLPTSSGMPSYITFNRNRYNGAGYLGAANNPFILSLRGGRFGRGPVRAESVSLPDGFTVSDLENSVKLRDRFEQRFRALDETDLPASLNIFQQQALDILRSDKINKALDLESEPQDVRERYGRSQLGQHALAARRLIQAGARFVTISSDGWDTHSGNFTALENRLLPPLDQALSSLLADLDKLGMLKDTIVYCAGEFGRTPRVNQSAGRDHWARSMSLLLAGGGFKKGYAHGSTDREGMAPASLACSPDDIAATVVHALGISPDHEATTTTGRPIPILREGKVIRGLFA